MRIGVISDTHIPKTASKLPSKLCEALDSVDLILHAGDIVEMSVINELRRIAEVKAVYGNMDPPEVRKELPKQLILKIGKFRIGLIHGFGPSRAVVKNVIARFDKSVNVIVFGHTHSPLNEMKGKTLLFNPGSPTDKFFAPFNSYGIIEVGDKISASIVKM